MVIGRGRRVMLDFWMGGLGGLRIKRLLGRFCGGL